MNSSIVVLLICLIPCLAFSQDTQQTFSPEEQAILDVITEETRSYFKRDVEAWKQTHVEADYYREYKYWDGWSDKVHTVNGWEQNMEMHQGNFNKKAPKSEWDSAKYIKSDVNIRISSSGDMAWVTFAQVAMNPKTKEVVGKSFETRVLEKHDGAWKIAYLGYHFLPKKALKAE